MDITKLAIEKTNNSDQIIAYHQQAFQAFNQFLLQIQAVGMGMADGIEIKTLSRSSKRQINQP